MTKLARAVVATASTNRTMANNFIPRFKTQKSENTIQEERLDLIIIIQFQIQKNYLYIVFLRLE